MLNNAISQSLIGVVSDQFEPVSERAMRLSFIPHRERATRREPRHG